MRTLFVVLSLMYSIPVVLAAGADGGAPYLLMDDDLAELKRDFNDAAERVRLVFIVGPT